MLPWNSSIPKEMSAGFWSWGCIGHLSSGVTRTLLESIIPDGARTCHNYLRTPYLQGQLLEAYYIVEMFYR